MIELRVIGEDPEVDGSIKGMPPGHPAVALSQLGKKEWSITAGDLPFPVAVLKQSAIATNREWMRQFLTESGALIAPHGKTTMSPQLFAMQLDDGAWGLTAATANQIAVYRKFGINRILMANQLVGRANIAFIANELVRDENFEFYTLVDSVAAAEMLANGAQAAGLERGFNVLIEIGARGARTGVRSVEEGLTLAKSLQRLAPHVRLCGVECYEGVFPTATPAERVQLSAKLFANMMMLADAIEVENLFAPGDILITAGGTEFFDLAARTMARSTNRRRTCIIRSGCYLTHDDLAYEHAFQRMLQRTPELERITPRLQPALEVWTCVQSRPEPNLALLTAGKRDVSFDFDLPMAKWWSSGGAQPERLGKDYECFRLNDQHIFLRIPDDSQLSVGDYVGLGVSHVCTTFDKWSLIYLVDDEYDVTGAIRTYF
ncbi:D-threonine aldolase [Tsuneonella dongtanensis]|uniref:D-threonine aldolase n=1 Tax=Tsuneonella dongtanensis TaxID=692370 RepID=A0A1B2A979_9SPHN|nr:hypothetical protein [Tsuneonella dongtanensis]ANY18634.1 D-threonine aldolase [Tsuneonella dongtanensis]